MWEIRHLTLSRDCMDRVKMCGEIRLNIQCKMESVGLKKIRE